MYHPNDLQGTVFSVCFTAGAATTGTKALPSFGNSYNFKAIPVNFIIVCTNSCAAIKQ